MRFDPTVCASGHLQYAASPSIPLRCIISHSAGICMSSADVHMTWAERHKTACASREDTEIQKRRSDTCLFGRSGMCCCCRASSREQQGMERHHHIARARASESEPCSASQIHPNTWSANTIIRAKPTTRLLSDVLRMALVIHNTVSPPISSELARYLESWRCLDDVICMTKQC
jgi:hypothetical protein